MTSHSDPPHNGRRSLASVSEVDWRSMVVGRLGALEHGQSTIRDRIDTMEGNMMAVDSSLRGQLTGLRETLGQPPDPFGKSSGSGICELVWRADRRLADAEEERKRRAAADAEAAAEALRVRARRQWTTGTMIALVSVAIAATGLVVKSCEPARAASSPNAPSSPAGAVPR